MKINKTIKALGLAILGLIFWSALVYIALAFLLVKLNPFIWPIEYRGFMLWLILCYIFFIPLIIKKLKDDI